MYFWHVLWVGITIAVRQVLSISENNFLKKIFFNVYLFLRENRRQSETQSVSWGGTERGRHRIWSRLQALSCQHTAQSRAGTHKLWDHDLSQCRTFNPLSHPGAPESNFLNLYICIQSQFTSFNSMTKRLRPDVIIHGSGCKGERKRIIVDLIIKLNFWYFWFRSPFVNKVSLK